MDYKKSFWEGLYSDGDTGWDLGYPSPPIKEYIDQMTDKSLSILIPGAGNSYEAEYLHRNGYTNLTVVDISAQPLKNIIDRVPDFPKEKLLHENFFTHNGEYDLIFEQTFFCAIEKSLRKNYVQRMSELLKTGGKLVGVLFDDALNVDHPPYGGDKIEYQKLFEDKFVLANLERCYNSIPPRAGRELFIRFIKK